jgi:hypothetical protein
MFESGATTPPLAGPSLQAKPSINTATWRTTMPDPEVTILPASRDDRPEPPAMPTLWIIRYWEWRPADRYTPAGWRARTSMFPIDNPLKADYDASVLISAGCRRVQIIKISGDDHAST